MCSSFIACGTEGITLSNSQFEAHVNAVNALAGDTAALTDSKLRERFEKLRQSVNLALQAEVLLQRDIDYLVRDDTIELIDEFTGRVAENRKCPGGLQAALEAKEGLRIQPQGRVLNSITLHHMR